MPPTVKHTHSIRDLAQAAIDLTATEIVKGLGMVLSIAVPIVVSVVGGVWYLSAEVTTTRAKIDDATKAVAELSAKLDNRDNDSTAMRDRLIRVEDSVAWCCRTTPKSTEPARKVGAGEVSWLTESK